MRFRAFSCVSAYDGLAKLSYLTAKYFNASNTATKVRIINKYDEQKYFLFGSGAGATTLCAIIYVRKSGSVYCTSLGTKTVTVAKDGNDGVLTVGNWGSGMILSHDTFTTSLE